MSSAESKILESRALAYRDYPEDLKASVIAAITANNGNVNGTAKLFNLSRDTVNYWWRNSDRYVELQQAKPRELADKMENIAHSLADSIEGHDLSIVSLAHKATAMGIVIDKMQLLRGQPTSITVEVERAELTVILQSSLAGGLDLGDGAIDVGHSVVQSGDVETP